MKHLTPLLLALFLTACGIAPSDSTTDEGTPVRTGVASSGPAVASLNTNGIVAARDEMRLSFKTGGIIRRIAVQEGQAVKKVSFSRNSSSRKSMHSSSRPNK